MAKCKVCKIEIKAMPFAKTLASYGYCVEHCPVALWETVFGKKKTTRKAKKRHKTRIQCSGKKANGNRCRITSGRADPTGTWYCKYHKHQRKAVSKNDGWEKKKEKYYKYLDSPEWKEKRKIVLSVLGETCKMCGSSGNVVHHNTYDRIYKENLFKDLTVLCEECHSFADAQRKKRTGAK